MKQKKTSSTILAVAYFLSAVLIISLLILIAVSVISKKEKNRPASKSGPDYAMDTLRVWDTQNLPDASAFLTENAKNMVKSARYAVLPEMKIGDQTVAILMQMEDGTVRTENAVLSVREPVVHLELGTTGATPQSLLGDEYEGAAFSQALEEFTAVGSYPISIVSGTDSLPFTLIVEDTTAPVVDLRSPAQFALGQEVRPEDFVVSCQDAQAVTYSFQTAPDTSSNGTRTVSILATDASGNSHTYEAVYTITGDGEAPTISGLTDMKTIVNMKVNYLRGVTAEDAKDGTVEVTAAEPEGFDIATAGEYMITYTASDTTGNVVTQTAKLTVLPDLSEIDSFTVEDAYRIGDAIIAETITDETLPEEKRARKVYRYVQDHMWYKDNKNVKPWYQSAVTALYNGCGDCRNYYGFARLLLDCAGFENMEVERVCASENESKHFWNLVKINGQWYHFDTTPRVGRSDFFMLTDAQLDAYNASQSDKPFNRDKSKYPATAP